LWVLESLIHEAIPELIPADRSEPSDEEGSTDSSTTSTPLAAKSNDHEAQLLIHDE
jgi:hypothetical protein